MPTEFVVRRARPHEFSAAADVAVASFLHDGPLSHDQRELADAITRGDIAEVLLAVAPDGAIAGTACLLPNTSEHAHIAEVGERELRLLAVAPDFRRSGIGEVLLHGCTREAACDGATAVVLSAQPVRKAARALYERLGFARMPDRDWHRDGIDLLVYGLPVEPRCGLCGELVSTGGHADCGRQLAFEPPRYCAACGRRMVVQVTPTGWTARCSEHGTTCG